MEEHKDKDDLLKSGEACRALFRLPCLVVCSKQMQMVSEFPRATLAWFLPARSVLWGLSGIEKASVSKPGFEASVSVGSIRGNLNPQYNSEPKACITSKPCIQKLEPKPHHTSTPRSLC